MIHTDQHEPLERMHDCEVCKSAVGRVWNDWSELAPGLGPSNMDELIARLRFEARAYLEEVYD